MPAMHRPWSACTILHQDGAKRNTLIASPLAVAVEFTPLPVAVVAEGPLQPTIANKGTDRLLLVLPTAFSQAVSAFEHSIKAVKKIFGDGP
ncbi:hypothetical protein MKK68_18450 [Methylobacterium sp. E-016]|uniref:hypothetical protein n=1 Tax=Methylobacterium sp. E-016 TaxID=2836556 RepID=UPI001FB9483C|nr:hypothetical protein [Methylobacterium sp. E-016]MCJ2077607.1 hypothetical protein [Methylobacterium sp. E-016]